MITYISWDPSVENDKKVIRRLPETPFECPKLNRGDMISLDVGRLKAPRILTPVKVAESSISISWDAIVNPKKATIKDVEQYLYVEPLILERSEST